MSTQNLAVAPETPVPDLRDESPQVREALSALGRLLGVAVSEPPRNLQSFLSACLKAPTNDLEMVFLPLSGVDAPLVQVAVARLLAAAPSAVLTDDLATGSPGYQLVTIDVDEQVAAPNDLAAYLTAAEGFGFDVVLILTWLNSMQIIQLHVRRAHRDAARSALSDLVERACGVQNFYRGRTLQVRANDRGVVFAPVEIASAPRSDLVHAGEVWAEIDANLGGLIKHRDLLLAAGLGLARGLLIVGPPGVGKTALCRVIATELPDETTILIVNADVTARGLGLIYDATARLAPAAVLLDDIDLLAGDRRAGTAGSALRELLTHLDGFSPLASVITVATTNVVDGIDPALLRAGRFDAVIEIGLPDRTARQHILQRYLHHLGEFDTSRIADATPGATGADLREVVRRAVLECGAALRTPDLLDVISTGRWKANPPTGQYL